MSAPLCILAAPSAAEEIAEEALAENVAERINNVGDVVEMGARLPSRPAWP